MGTLIVGTILAALIGLAGYKVIKDRKSGKGCGGCGNGCRSCAQSHNEGGPSCRG